MGLLAALLWGGTDFLVGLNVRAVGVKRAVFFKERLTAVQVTGVVLVLLGALVLHLKT